jgi:hypothetical protein
MAYKVIGEAIFMKISFTKSMNNKEVIHATVAPGTFHGWGISQISVIATRLFKIRCEQLNLFSQYGGQR